LAGIRRHTPGAEAPCFCRIERPKAKALGYLEAKARTGNGVKRATANTGVLHCVQDDDGKTNNNKTSNDCNKQRLEQATTGTSNDWNKQRLEQATTMRGSFTTFRMTTWRWITT
jgi:hypothetical protein